MLFDALQSAVLNHRPPAFRRRCCLCGAALQLFHDLQSQERGKAIDSLSTEPLRYAGKNQRRCTELPLIDSYHAAFTSFIHAFVEARRVGNHY